ncbi:MAG: hypothetical protein J6P45_10205 [Lachnospiraceae bacterium]|nr:hypothetical protein [Lachnospiraceae bacterium]
MSEEKKNIIHLHAITDNEDKNMANGMRNTKGTPLNDRETEYVKSEIRRIQADEKVFVFNDPEHMHDSTCYNFEDDKVYVTRNVFPDEMYASAHPRDTMSVGAVLAHEYYGHRHYRQEYLSDWEKGKDYHTTPLWQDECRASLTAAQITPGLTEIDKRDLVLDAVYRAKEFGQLIEMNDFMKEAVYGYNSNERKITRDIEQPHYVSEDSQERNPDNGVHECKMSKVRRITRDYDDFER